MHYYTKYFAKLGKKRGIIPYPLLKFLNARLFHIFIRILVKF